MTEIKQQLLTGERALFMCRDLVITDSTFADGESHLKESANIELFNSMFKWKYPLWYSENIKLKNCTFFDTARAGVWYTHNISFENCTIAAPKTFRHASDIKLENVTIPHASETMWWCEKVTLNNVSACGDYFAMQSQDMEVNNLDLVGNYGFDGAKNVTIRNSRLLTKDAFWNCENVTVHDSFISGEYLGWNSKNLTLINCTIESLQGLCYIENLVLINCKLLNTTLAFEYSTVQADIVGSVDSVLNPSGGRICADSIDKLIIEKDKIDPQKTVIICRSKN
ncbi:MAG: DUF3737 family protein [Clostridiales bacterium]|nr:DUF3737 family protein [Clostridiales bacterium]